MTVTILTLPTNSSVEVLELLLTFTLESRYIRTCGQLACCCGLGMERRNEFFDEMIKCLEDTDKGK